MAKKVLVISASARRNGNSDTLANRFIEGAKEAGNQVEKVFLKDKTINYCSGCGVCNTTRLCVQKDDMKELIDQFVAADIIVFATPVYFYAMNGQMKTFIDRLVPRYTEMNNKKFYLIMTAAEDEATTLDKTIIGFQGLLDCLEGVEIAGIIRGTGAWKIGDIVTKPVMKEAYIMGKSV